MDQASAQTEKIASYETSRTRRSIVDGKIRSDDSNNDEEYATSGFYVREKTTKKKPDSASIDSIGSDKETKECKENGISPQVSSPPSSVKNGEDSKDGESSRDSKEDNDTGKNTNLDQDEKENEPSSKEDTRETITSEHNETSGSPKEQEDKKVSDGADKSNKKSGEDTEDCDKIEDTGGPKPAKEDSKVEEKKNEEKQAGTTERNDKDKDIGTKDDKENKKGDKKSKEVDRESKEEEKVSKQNKESKGEDKKIKDKEVSKTQSESKEEDSGNDKGKDENKDDAVEVKKDAKEDGKAKEDKKEKEADLSLEIIEQDPAKKDNEKESKSDEVKDVSEKEKEEFEVSILKDHLEKASNGYNDDTMETEMEMDEDFDPSLLCPDISMDVDEARVITNNETIPEDGSSSPLPYEATFSTLVDEITGAEVQVDLTPEEMELRSKMYGPNNQVQTTKIHCTACNIHLGSALTGANNRFVHPLLKVLICKNCYHFYTSGEFEKDEDGSELYCRWCGQGGQVLCCSSCEFVFCKRCIRNNFGPKKFKEIRDSDDWNCFRCDRGQLSNLRASCAEFMEYYRTELARAQALSQTNPELMTTDHTTCCKGGTDKKEENKAPAQKKNITRKRKDEEDPDYHPIVEEDVGEPPKKKFNTSAPTGGPGYTIIPPSKPPMTKPGIGQVIRPVIMQGQRPQNQGQVFKVGNTTFRAKAPMAGPGYTVQRPTVTAGQKSNSPGYITIPPSAGKKSNTPGYTTIPPSAGQKSNSPGYITIPPSAAPKTTSPGYITIPPSAAPRTTTPGYIKILPQRMQSPRPTSYTVVSGTSNGKPTFTTVRPKQPAVVPPMKHEWFEKTVRAAARVNSNLSYTLTQLNRQQSQASSVEALAMVHNKLQEVLSTSINSLIQIRKNLRTEFIAGIKNIKFPPKPAPIPSTSGPIVVKDDDDVIFVNPPQPANQLPPPPPLVLSPSVSLTKKTPIQTTSDPFADPKPSTSGVSSKLPASSKSSTTSNIPPAIGGGFLKVRSFTSLQSVPSECITIPDDPPASSDIKLIEEEDPLKITDDDKPKDDEKELPKSPAPKEDTSTFTEFMVYNVKDEPTPAIKKMFGAVVKVKKSRVVDEIIRAQGLLSGKGKENDKKEKEKENDEKEKEKENDTKDKEVGNDNKEKEEENKEDKGTEGEGDTEKKDDKEASDKEEDKDTRGKKEEEETNKKDSAKIKEKA